MKNIFIFILVFVCITKVHAEVFKPEMFDVTSINELMSDEVVFNEVVSPGDKIARSLYEIAEVYKVQGKGTWKRFDTLKDLEDSMGDQAPLHKASLVRLKELSEKSYWIYRSDADNLNFNAYLYVESDGKVEIISFWKWLSGEEPSGQGLKFSSSENRYELTEDIRKRLDIAISDPSNSPYFGSSGYSSDQSLLISLNEPFASELSSRYKEVGDPGASFSAPYIWGKYVILHQKEADAIYNAHINDYQADFKYADFSLSLFKTIKDFEKHIGKQVPLRSNQVSWPNEVAVDYYILHARYDGELFGYNDFLHFHSVNDHKPFMTILLNSDDYYQE